MVHSQQGDTSTAAEAGLVVLRASRLEALLSPLQALLDATRPGSVLEPQTVVAAHPGMKQWLVGELARQAGPGRVVANLDVRLPSQWLDRLAQQCLGHSAVALPGYQRKHLRWTLHELLDPDHPATGVDDPRIAAYLGAGASTAERELRRFQLADRLAGIFSQYPIYRPDWLQAWERGDFRYATRGYATQRHATQGQDADVWRVLESRLLGPLWRQVQRALGPHRATLMTALQQALQAGQGPRTPVHLFGLSHLAPAEMAVLRDYARHAPVFLYVPDPCREYWGGLVHHQQPSGWADYQQAETARIRAAGAGDYWHDQGHPLLARWGRMGQHFFATLGEGEVREDQRHWQDELPLEKPWNRLARLQQSLRLLAPDQLRESFAQTADFSDASVRIHSCHTRLRELEVLRDALLDAIEHDGVRAGDMVVMAPDMSAYAPLIPAVFGEPGSARERLLPYHLADVPLAGSHRLFAAFTRLLALGSSRITTPEVVDLLSMPDVQRRLGLDGDAIETLQEWLARSRVAWSLDASHRASLGLPASSEHGFAWAMDRMIAGYLMSDDPDADRTHAITLPDGTRLLPVTGAQGPAAEVLGSLDRLLIELQRWQNLAHSQRRASDWALELQARFDALFCIDNRDEDASLAAGVLKKLIATLASEPACAGSDPLLPFAVVRDLLRDGLNSVPERQPFLMGGITFCGMVPQRAIPFAVVCVLGLDDGAFPRQHSDGGLDLMTAVRRIGDRDVRTDDRYLFLETVMSARKRLHLSYIGQGARDGKPRNPAAPVAELLAEFERAGAWDAPVGEDAHTSPRPRPWLIQHPLQPFDARYFDGHSPALFSYSADFAGMQGAGDQPVPPFTRVDLVQGDPTPADPLPSPLPLSALLRFWKRPADDLLCQRLPLDLAALENDRLPASEPLEAKLSPRETIARRTFFADALPMGAASDGGPAWSRTQMPAWVELGGLLPPGELGRQAWDAEANAIEALLGQAMTLGLLGQRGASMAIDVQLPVPGNAPVRLVGRVQQVFANSNGAGLQLVRAFASANQDPGKALKRSVDLDLGDRLSVFIEWAALRLHSAHSAPLVPLALSVLAKDPLDLAEHLQLWDAQLLAADASVREGMLASLRSRLAELVGLWAQATAEPPVYFPKASHGARTAWRKAISEGAVVARQQAANAAVKLFDGNDQPGQGERQRAPYATRVLARGLRLEGDGAALSALLDYAERLEALMRLDTREPQHDGPSP